ncbi:hypothetical protein LTR50_007359 [Elasticomyces elasticus]|nr:hypothetical protein LTR50_007359 [Elasticomyces elasticus]
MTVFFGRDSQLQKLMGTIQDNLKLLEQREIYVIGDKLNDLQQLTEALAQDDSSKYTHYGAGHIVANEGGKPTNYFGGSGNSRQVNNPGVYYEGNTDNEAAPERPETPPKSSSNVPFRSDPDFVEREELTAQLRAKLSVPVGRAALVGLGGAGKSQLAIEYARTLRQQAPQTWVLCIHASSVTRFEQSVQDVADQLKSHGRQDPKTDLLPLLRNWLRDETKGKWLIVLDNADDASFLLEPPIAADGAQRARRRIDYIPTYDHGSMIVTTRSKSDALKIVYESDTIDVLPMSEAEAVALLEKKLGKLGSQAEKRQLVKKLDCIPLAVTHAAAYMLQRTPRCSVQQYCEALEQSRTSRTSLLRRDFKHPSQDAQASNYNLALTYSDHERWAEAKALQLQAVSGWKKSYGLTHPHTLTATSTLIYVQRMQ